MHEEETIDPHKHAEAITAEVQNIAEIAKKLRDKSQDLLVRDKSKDLEGKLPLTPPSRKQKAEAWGGAAFGATVTSTVTLNALAQLIGRNDSFLPNATLVATNPVTGVEFVNTSAGTFHITASVTGAGLVALFINKYKWEKREVRFAIKMLNSLFDGIYSSATKKFPHESRDQMFVNEQMVREIERRQIEQGFLSKYSYNDLQQRKKKLLKTIRDFNRCYGKFEKDMGSSLSELGVRIVSLKSKLSDAIEIDDGTISKIHEFIENSETAKKNIYNHLRKSFRPIRRLEIYR